MSVAAPLVPDPRRFGAFRYRHANTSPRSKLSTIRSARHVTRTPIDRTIWAMHPLIRGMSCPVSSRRSGNFLLILLEEVLKGAVDGRVVGGVVLPAAPDDGGPGSCEDPDGVGVVVATGAGVLVQLGGPGVDVAGVGSEVAYRVAELLVRTPPEDHRLDLAGLTGRGSNPGQAGQGVRGGEPAPSVADLGQQPGRADGPRPRQAGED